MPRQLLTSEQKWYASYAAYADESRRWPFLQELLRTCTTVINVGPRGGLTWGTGRMPTASYEVVKQRLGRRGFDLIEDLGTGKVHIRARG